MKNNYDERAIEVIKGLEVVRKRPTVYMGPRGDDMLFQMLKEPVDNCLDEALEGRNTYIEVYLDLQNDEYFVSDKGNGIPVGIHHTEKKSTLEVVMTQLHAGGKFGSKGYKQATAGTHGIGVAATNALSTQFEVWTYRDAWFHQSYSKGKPLETVSKQEPKSVHKFLKNKSNIGTIVRFVPDHSIIDHETRAKLDIKRVYSWLKTLSLMNKGIRIALTVVTAKGIKTAEFLNKEGPTLLLTKRVKELDVETISKPFLVDNDKLTCAFVFTNSDSDEELQSFVNTIPTKNGGTHVRGFMNALSKVLSSFRKKNQKIETKDLMLGLVGLLNVKVKEPEFKGQIKEELVSPVTKIVEDALFDELNKFFGKNKTLAKDLIRKALEIKESREQFKKVVQTISGVKKAKKIMLPGVLASAKCDPSKRELYIVEGDSSAGTAKKARDSAFQEVFKLTGKSINAVRATTDKLMDNKVIQNLFVALGIDINNLDAKTLKVDCSKLRVNKLFLLADADEDGSHISLLILTVLYKYFPALIREGRVYVVDAPLFHAFYKNKHYFGSDFNECYKSMPKGASKNLIIRSKGWGECSPETLSIVAFNPSSRGTIQVTWPETKKQVKHFERIMGQDSDVRKQLLGL